MFYYLFDLFFTYNNPLLLPNSDIVINSSYVIYENQNDFGQVPSNSSYVSFYTYNGKLISTIKHYFLFDLIDKKIDTSSPKPEPTYSTIYYNTYDNDFNITPGYYLKLYDKHHNLILCEKFEYKSLNNP